MLNAIDIYTILRFTSPISLKLTACYSDCNGMHFFLDLGALTFAFAWNNIGIDRRQFAIIICIAQQIRLKRPLSRSRMRKIKIRSIPPVLADVRYFWLSHIRAYINNNNVCVHMYNMRLQRVFAYTHKHCGTICSWNDIIPRRQLVGKVNVLDLTVSSINANYLLATCTRRKRDPLLQISLA